MVIEQSTTAEDLAGPIADSSKQLNLLRDYQFQLESIRGRVTSDIDSRIKINKELSQVQTQGLSSAITGLAFLIPWALLLIAFTWTGRKLWRRWSRANYPQ